MKNNKGFTFVELLAVITLLSIALILTISQVQQVNNNSKIRLCKNKLSLIEESLNLYLKNNRSLFSSGGLCEEEPVSGICYTSVLKIAEQGIIDYDKDENIINPVNNKILNNYKVKIIYDSGNDKFSSEIQKRNETVSDKNYDTICGKSTGIKEEDNDKSIFDKKLYSFNIIKIEEDGSEAVINFNVVEKAPNEIGNYCKDLNFDGKDEYTYVNYEIENDTTVNCIYKKGIRYSLSIIKGNGIVIDNIDKYTNKKYKINESVTIKFRVEGNYLFDSISCNSSNATSCEYNPDDSTIKVTFKNKEDIVLTINSKDMLNVKMFYENLDTDFYDYDSSGDKLVATDVDAENYCKSNVRNNYEYFKYDSSNNSCYYKLKRTNLSFDLSDTNIVSVLVNPGSKTMSGTTSTINDYYKYGQKITLKVNYKNGYEYDSIVCISGECTLNEDGTITLVSYADSVSIVPKSKKIPPKYMVYHHYQDADDINGYSSVLMNNSVSFDDTISDSTLLSNLCDTVENYNYISSISYYDKSNHEVNCYYDRKLFNVTFKKGDKYVTGINVTPGSNISLGNVDLTSGGTRTYRFGQEIIMGINGYSSDYKYKTVVCSDASKCNVGNGGKTKIIVPNNNNLVVTVNSQDIVKTFNVYYHYQDADDVNGYTVLKNYTVNISLPANYDQTDPNVTDRDLINSKRICESENVLAHFTYNNAISYLDRSKSEINCYFEREEVSVTFDKSDSYVTGVTIVPTNSSTVGNTSLSTTTTYKYRYGQEILMKINGYTTDYMYSGVSCSNSNLCVIGNDGTTKITATENLTIKPVSKPLEIPYKIYNHYQDADDANGFTTKYINTVGIVLSTGDNTNYSNICSSQSVEDYYTYNSALGYLDRSKKEINCYFERKEVSVTFDKSDSYISGVTIVPTNSSTVGNTSLTETATYKYRYGQEILMKINGYTTDYMYSGVTCSNSNLCTIGNAGTTKINAIQNLTIKPISKPLEVAYKLYNHYQDSNNVNGYTSEVKDISVVLSVGDANNVTNFCSKEGKTGYTYYSAPSYMDRSKKEIDCYFNLN